MTTRQQFEDVIAMAEQLRALMAAPLHQIGPDLAFDGKSITRAIDHLDTAVAAYALAMVGYAVGTAPGPYSHLTMKEHRPSLMSGTGASQ